MLKCMQRASAKRDRQRYACGAKIEICRGTCEVALAGDSRPHPTLFAPQPRYGRTIHLVQWRALLPTAQTVVTPRFPLSGEEVMAAGVPKGPLVGEVMREVEAWWVENDFPNDKLALIERLKAVAQGMAY